MSPSAGFRTAASWAIDAQLRTRDPNICAAGDTARWPDPQSGQLIRVEHWVMAERQGKTVGQDLRALEIERDMEAARG